MIGIVSYGVGNVRAFMHIYARYGLEVAIADSPERLQCASHLILPGVGSFDWAMERLDASGLRPVLEDLALNRGRPVLGVCVGMQMMADGSDEGDRAGLGWIPGHVGRFTDATLRLPHMGWNDVAATADPLFDGLNQASFYFLHSYYVSPATTTSAIARADYGAPFVCGIRRDRIAGVQFHPEKSHHWGERLLLNFARS